MSRLTTVPGGFMKTFLRCSAFLLLLCSVVQESQGIGRIYARWPNNENSPIYNLRIKSLTASVVIQDQLAVTSVDQVFTNDNNFRLEGFYIFRLPEGAQVNEMYLWINGVRTPYVIKKRADAVVQYQEIVRKISDPAILEQLGKNLFQLRVYPIEALNTRRIEIQYSQPLTYFKGSIQYTFPLDMTDYTSAPIEVASVSIDLKSQLPFTSVETSIDQNPTASKVTKIDDRHYSIVYGVEKVAFAKDFVVRADVNRDGHSMLALTYAAPDSLKEAPYFILWANTPDTLGADTLKGRELTFVADISSSMEGTRLTQLKDALTAFIDILNEKDKFNIATFSTNVVLFRSDLVPATSSVRDSARNFVQKLTALGLTNIEEALHASLLQSYKDTIRAGIIFLSDGQASWGEIRTDTIAAHALRWNRNNVRIFPVAVGQEADYSLLEKLAQQSSGIYTKVASEDSIYLQIRELYRLVILPVLKNVGISFTQLDAYDIHPTPLPLLYAGDQLLVAGRCTKSGSDHVVLTGNVLGQPFTVEDIVEFPDTGKAAMAVARYWGAKKIESLLAMIAALGEKTELVDQVVALSIRYSVLTPYTAFLVVEPTNNTGSAVVTEPPAAANSFALWQNYPNPFNPSTVIRYTVPEGNPILVTIIIYDDLGREVKRLVTSVHASGTYEAIWNGTDTNGRPVTSGVYLSRMVAGTFVETRTMTLMR